MVEWTGEQVLRQADDATCQASADGIATSRCEEDGHHQRQVNDGEVADPYRDEDLDQDGDQRDEDDRRPTEIVNRNLLPRGEASAIRHDSSAHCGGSVVGGLAGWSGFVVGACSEAGCAFLVGVVEASPFGGACAFVAPEAAPLGGD